MGIALGMYLSHKGGGLGSMFRRLRTTRGAVDEHTISDSVYEMDGLTHDDGEYGALEDSLEDDPDEDAVAAQLEERVLAAFLNDPVLARKQVEISAEGDGVVSLAGSVENESDSQHAALIAGGIPGVLGVSNGIRIRAARRRQAQ
jgi:hypothetical protein